MYVDISFQTSISSKYMRMPNSILWKANAKMAVPCLYAVYNPLFLSVGRSVSMMCYHPLNQVIFYSKGVRIVTSVIPLHYISISS